MSNNISKYEEGWFFHSHAWYTLHEVLKNIRNFEFEYNSILDFGAGSGLMASVIKAIFPDIKMYVTDKDIDCADFWNKRNLNYEFIDFFQEDFKTIPNQYDILICNHVLEHLDFVDLHLRKFARLADRLIIVVPEGEVNDPTHRIVFDRVSFKRIIDANIEYSYLNIYPQYHPHINNLIAVVDI